MREDRIAKIQELRTQGKSVKEIGKELGVSRERIRQIAKQYIPDFQFKLKREQHTRMCALAGCGNIFVIQSSKSNQKFCSPQCTHLARRTVGVRSMSKEEYRRYNRIRMHEYYHTHLKGTAKFKERTRLVNIRGYKCFKERMAADPIYAARMKEIWRKKSLTKTQALKNKLEKLKDDPLVIMLRKMFRDDK